MDTLSGQILVVAGAVGACTSTIALFMRACCRANKQGSHSPSSSTTGKFFSHATICAVSSVCLGCITVAQGLPLANGVEMSSSSAYRPLLQFFIIGSTLCSMTMLFSSYAAISRFFLTSRRPMWRDQQHVSQYNTIFHHMAIWGSALVLATLPLFIGPQEADAHSSLVCDSSISSSSASLFIPSVVFWFLPVLIAVLMQLKTFRDLARAMRNTSSSLDNSSFSAIRFIR